jgi:hypothetical protein
LGIGADQKRESRKCRHRQAEPEELPPVLVFRMIRGQRNSRAIGEYLVRLGLGRIGSACV